MTAVDEVVSAIEAGRLAIVPTDTVYGLCCRPEDEDAVRRLSEVKGRAVTQPIAIVAIDVDALLARIPELRGRSETIAHTLLPGPYTLVLANPAERYPWLNGETPGAVGVRVPAFDGVGHELLARVGAMAATSANLAGGPDPRRLGDVPPVIVAACAAVLDGGELPGTPSTVLDFTGPGTRVVRAGLGDVPSALARVAAALGAGGRSEPGALR